MFSRLKAAFTGGGVGGGSNSNPDATTLEDGGVASSPVALTTSAAVGEQSLVQSDSGSSSSSLALVEASNALQPYGSPAKRRGASNPALWERPFKPNEFYPNPMPVLAMVASKEDSNGNNTNNSNNSNNSSDNLKVAFKPLEAKLDDGFFVKLYPLLKVTFKLPVQSNIFPSKIIDSDDIGFISIRDYSTKAMIKKFASGFGCVKIINIWEVMGGKFQLIVTGSTDSWIRVFDVEGKLLRKIENPHGGKRITTMMTLQDHPYEDTYIISGGDDCAVRFWGLKSTKLLWECLGHRCRIVSMCWALGQKVPGMAILQKYLVSMDRSGEIRLWSPTDGRCIRVINLCPEAECEIPDPLKKGSGLEEADEGGKKKKKKKKGGSGAAGDDDIDEDTVTITDDTSSVVTGAKESSAVISEKKGGGGRAATPGGKAKGVSGGSSGSSKTNASPSASEKSAKRK